MTLSAAFRRFGPPLLLATVMLALLALVVAVYTVGQTLLAGLLLVIVGLTGWIYTSRKLYALRYLFPGAAAALLFVVFPMVYTIAIGFTNQTSQNLLDYNRAKAYFLDESVRGDGPGYAFSLHATGNEFLARLEPSDDGPALVFGPLALITDRPVTVKPRPAAEVPAPPGEPLSIRDVIARQAALKAITVVMPDQRKLRMTGLREFAEVNPVYEPTADGGLKSRIDGSEVRANMKTGFFEKADGTRLAPGFQINVGFDNYRQIFSEPRFREPFMRIFVWTVVFSGLTVLFAAALGMLLAVLLSWDALRGKRLYRLALFLPYAVPGFISILIFKGLFNQNTGEINLILSALFGIKPAWFSDPLLAKIMLLIVNVWLGFPYMMVICMGLIKAIPADLYEASAVAGAGPITNFFSITLPLISRPLTPLLIAAFAFNFNNFVLISLLTGGRPDFLDTSVPAGETDLLVSYTWRIAFQDSGQNFALAAAISTVIFLIVAAISLVQMRFTRASEDART